MALRHERDAPASASAKVLMAAGEEPGGPTAPEAHALLLQAWLSPSFPVGSFAYSHGLEAAAERGWVRDRPSLEAWLHDIVAHGGLGNDLVLLAAAWRAVRAQDWVALAAVAELSVALQPTAERHLEATQQGRSFLTTIAAAWPCAAAARLDEALAGAEVAYPVAVGAATAGHTIPLASVLPAYALAVVSSLVSAAIRLSLVGQTDGQRVLAALRPAIAAAADRAGDATLDDLASATLMADIASILHETQHTRLFRS